MRGTETHVRRTKYTSCFTKGKKFTPLYDLTDEIENAIYEKYQIEVPKIYDELTRTGCIGCPYGYRYGDTEKELALINKAQKDFVCEYFKESYKVLGINTENEM